MNYAKNISNDLWKIDVRSFTRSIRSFNENIRSPFWWRSFTRGSYIFDQDRKLYLFIVHFEFKSLISAINNISGIYIVILIWFPKSNGSDRTCHDPRLSHDRPVGRTACPCLPKPKICSFHDFSFSRNQSDYYIFITTYEK